MCKSTLGQSFAILLRKWFLSHPPKWSAAHQMIHNLIMVLNFVSFLPCRPRCALPSNGNPIQIKSLSKDVYMKGKINSILGWGCEREFELFVWTILIWDSDICMEGKCLSATAYTPLEPIACIKHQTVANGEKRYAMCATTCTGEFEYCIVKVELMKTFAFFAPPDRCRTELTTTHALGALIFTHFGRIYGYSFWLHVWVLILWCVFWIRFFSEPFGVHVLLFFPYFPIWLDEIRENDIEICVRIQIALDTCAKGVKLLPSVAFLSQHKTDCVRNLLFG